MTATPSFVVMHTTVTRHKEHHCHWSPFFFAFSSFAFLSFVSSMTAPGGQRAPSAAAPVGGCLAGSWQSSAAPPRHEQFRLFQHTSYQTVPISALHIH